MRKLEGKWFMKKKIRMISKDDRISKFPGYTSFKEKEEVDEETKDIFSPKPSMHYLNITMRHMGKVFCKRIILGSGSGVGESEMLMEEEEIVKLIEEEEIVDLELQDHMKVWFVQKQAKEGAFVGFLRDQCVGLKMTNKDKVWLRLRLPFFRGKCGGALGANKSSTHLGPLDLVEAACALEVEAMKALDLVKEEASFLLGPLNVVGVSLNILISASVRGYLTSLKQTTSSSPEKPSSLDTSTTSVKH
nr:hypothetical protein [Tanacetum cinerariifolium]